MQKMNRGFKESVPESSNHKPKNYLLRNIPLDLWLKARVKSTRLGYPMRSVFLNMLQYWVDNNFKME